MICFVKALRFCGGFFHFRTVFVYAVVRVSLADTVVKYDLNLGGLLT